MISSCTSISCIDASAVAFLFSIVLGCWATGYGLGQGVLWVRRLSEVV